MVSAQEATADGPTHEPAAAGARSAHRKRLDRSPGASFNEQRKSRPLTMPVLAIGGAASWGERVGDAMQPLADHVQSVVIPGAGHWVAEQAPEETLAALTAFLAPYRDGSAAARDARPHAAAASAP